MAKTTKVRVEGLPEFKKALANLETSKLAGPLGEILSEAAGTVLTKIQANAPVDTGNMRDNFEVEDPKSSAGRVSVAVGPNSSVEHIARFNEYGTVKMQPNAFIRRSVSSVRSQIARFMKSKVGALIESQVKSK